MSPPRYLEWCLAQPPQNMKFSKGPPTASLDRGGVNQKHPSAERWGFDSAFKHHLFAEEYFQYMIPDWLVQVVQHRPNVYIRIRIRCFLCSLHLDPQLMP